MKVNELKGAALDWAVAKCESVPLVLAPFTGARNFVILGQDMKPTIVMYEPSIYWAQGGPIIEREKITVCYDTCQPRWVGCDWAARLTEFGPTPLIAAMRCYVASKLGDDVEIPEELK
jgi:hypothetical protein